MEKVDISHQYLNRDVELGSLGSGNHCKFNDSERHHILIGLGISGLVSAIVCCIATVMVFLLRVHKLFAYRLAMYQVLSALFFSIVLCMELVAYPYGDKPDNTTKKLCTAMGFMLQYSAWVKLMFSICLTFHIFCFAVFLVNLKKLEIAYIIVSVFTPLLHAWIPFINNYFGLSGAWCWIRRWENDIKCIAEKNQTEKGSIEQFVLWYIPFFVAGLIDVIAIVVMVVVIVCRVYHRRSTPDDSARQPLLNTNQQTHKEALKQLMPLLVYPILFLILLLFGVAHRAHDAIYKLNISYPLTMIHAVVGFSWGFCAGIALISQLCVYKYCSKRRIMVQTVGQTQSTFAVTSIQTNAITNYVIPQESDIDEKILSSKKQ